MTTPALVPRWSWGRLWRHLSRTWRQGEHVLLVAPTGQGKTTLALRLLQLRDYVAIVSTKARDATLAQAVNEFGYRRVTRLGVADPELSPRLLVDVGLRSTTPEAIARQRERVAAVLGEGFVRGAWTLYVDEFFYVSKALRLANLAEVVMTQGRSAGVTMVVGFQRPAGVPVLAYDSATHAFFWRDNDEVNVRRLGGLVGADRRAVTATIPTLGRHEFLYVNTRTGTLARSRLRLAGRGGTGVVVAGG